MWLRRAFYRWLFPAALVLPLWLLLGWGVFQAGGWVFLWVLFIALPSVFVGQLALALLVRARPSVQTTKAVSWWDVAGFGLWHVLTIAVGCFSERWFPFTLTAAIIAGLALFWLVLRQLRIEMRAGGSFLHVSETHSYSTGERQPEQPRTLDPKNTLIVTDAEPRDETRREN